PVDRAEEDGRRVILHFDLDCFYAQVEMIRNPALRTKPLGVQQKYIIVTCNYVARGRGVTKLMGVKEALEKCPDLVLVKGEDLTHYREISYRVTGALLLHCYTSSGPPPCNSTHCPPTPTGPPQSRWTVRDDSSSAAAQCWSSSSPSSVDTGRCPQDAAPQDTDHRRLPTGGCPQEAAHRRLPTGPCPQDATPQDATPQDAAPQDAAPQDAAPQDTAPQDAGPQDAEVSSSTAVSDPLTPAPPTLTHHHDVKLLMSYCPLVERLGFDENFVDVTEMVEKRMRETSLSDLVFRGHIYGHEASAVGVRDHSRLAVGSVIAAELREALWSKLGLTSCAGVANSKLLAKLVSGTFKPNQQTTLLPQSSGPLMDSLSGPCKVPGIGYRTGAKLKALGVLSMRDLQTFPLRELIREFGEANGKRIQSLACGIDLSPVTPAGPPQSLSDEDSFKRISTVSEVESKVKDLLSSLCDRMRKDGRLPQTLRLTLRRATTDTLSRWFSRESRQCPIPRPTAQRIVSGCSEAVPQLVSIAMKLFHRVVDASGPFHLTLLNVCFSNLQTKTSSRNSISSFFTHTAPTAAHTRTREQETDADQASSSFTQTEDTQSSRDPKHTPLPTSSSSLSQSSLPQPTRVKSSTPPRNPPPEPAELDTRDSRTGDVQEERTRSKLPPHIDPDVFQALPEHIQMELMASFQAGASAPEDSVDRLPSSTRVHPEEPAQFLRNREETPRHGERAPTRSNHMTCNDEISAEDRQNDDMEGQRSHDRRAAESRPLAQTGHEDVPPNVDPLVFSQLPSDVQKELLAEWKQHKPALKLSSRETTRLGARHAGARDRRAAPRGSQSNSLLRYFKPH
ncbi:hypothetical protein NFI96_017980, partial [Prochilodus magdalenae]